MKIKIENKATKNYIVYDFDFKKHEVKTIENKLNNDLILKLIFLNKSYDDIINWIRSRVGGKTLNECIEIAKHNNLKSVKDDLLVFIEE